MAFGAVLSATAASAQCKLPNVGWSIPDSVTACPAGDSVVFSHSAQHPHASRLRIAVTYSDANCLPKVGVPPESIWVTSTIVLGNLKINDKSGTTHYPDDSTNSLGLTRIVFPSMSGCGKVRFRLFVAGVDQGTKTVIVRTTDYNADGRIGFGDLDPGQQCDVDWSGGQPNASDLSIVNGHIDHWRRNALHGALVRRTNLDEQSDGHGHHHPNTIGESSISWSPNGNWLAFSIHILVTAPIDTSCKLFTVPSDPNYGNVIRQFTFAAIDTNDYDPSWSPLGHEIVFDRGDYRILKKGIPGLPSDTTERLVAASGGPGTPGDKTPAISPDGQWVAFARRHVTGAVTLWKVPIGGGTPTKLTPLAAVVSEGYPRWSPDGEWIIYDHQNAFPGEHRIWKVRSNGDTTTAQEIYFAGANRNAATPAYSPDGLVVTTGIGTHDEDIQDTRTYVLDPTLASIKPILNYPDLQHAIAGENPVLSPVLSFDGTRLAIGTAQLWAARRNMSKPPKFTSTTSTNEGTRSLHDTTATMNFTMVQGSTSTIQVLATDPEGDGLTYDAKFLQSWMSWNPSTRVLTCSPPVPSGGFYFVRFIVTTPSGGTDSFIAKIEVEPTLGPGRLRSTAVAVENRSPNPTWGVLSLASIAQSGVTARLTVFDLAGRKVAEVSAPSGSLVTWAGSRSDGSRVLPGVYLWRLQVGEVRTNGKVVVVR